ncbi:MAG TPA: hypothetical protein HA346_05890 [Thermoplasmata archaeon]|nr:hypothetical protein [Thermoplasmata archaeon]
MKIGKSVMSFVLILFLSFVSTAMAGSEGETNTIYGQDAGINLTTGSNNTFIGAQAGKNNTSASYNTFVGIGTGNINSTGERNTFIGSWAGCYNTTGYQNSFFGENAGQKNTEGNYNAFHGQGAGFLNTTGSRNTFVGVSAGRENTTAGWNTFLGQSSGYLHATGHNNTFLGFGTGYNNVGGQGNVFIGYSTGAEETGSNKLYIDNSETNTPLIWGDFNTNNVVIYGGFRAIASYSSSDERLKKNIQPLESSLQKLSNLKGIAYEWRKEDYPGMGLTEGKQIGLIAQDVEKEMPELVSEDKDGYKAVSYTRLTAVLVEAIKELKTLNENQNAKIERQNAEIERLRALIEESKG